MIRVYLGLGSNLEKPLQQLNLAKKAIEKIRTSKLLRCSSIYQSEAITLDDEPQNDYLNAVVEIETALQAEELLDALQSIENKQGRVRDKRWGARTIDIDILLFGDQVIDNERLSVPHKELQNRNFVLSPLIEISSELEIPGKGNVLTLLANVKNQPLKKIGKFSG